MNVKVVVYVCECMYRCVCVVAQGLEAGRLDLSRSSKYL